MPQDVAEIVNGKQLLAIVGVCVVSAATSAITDCIDLNSFVNQLKVNAHLSCSSAALASKATGYPLLLSLLPN